MKFFKPTVLTIVMGLSYNIEAVSAQGVEAGADKQDINDIFEQMQNLNDSDNGLTQEQIDQELARLNEALQQAIDDENTVDEPDSGAQEPAQELLDQLVALYETGDLNDPQVQGRIEALEDQLEALEEEFLDEEDDVAIEDEEALDALEDQAEGIVDELEELYENANLEDPAVLEQIEALESELESLADEAIALGAEDFEFGDDHIDLDEDDFAEIEEALNGGDFGPEDLEAALSDPQVQEFIGSLTPEQIAELEGLVDDFNNGGEISEMDIEDAFSQLDDSQLAALDDIIEGLEVEEFYDDIDPDDLADSDFDFDIDDEFENEADDMDQDDMQMTDMGLNMDMDMEDPEHCDDDNEMMGNGMADMMADMDNDQVASNQ